jgi:CheY-like chemotaxis protein
MDSNTRRQAILIVDDDESIRTTLRLALEITGYNVIEATEGREALVKLHEAKGTPPLVILCDWSMGGEDLDGEAFLRAVKRDPALTGIPVVVVSGTAGRSALRQGAAYLIRKPFDLDHLLAAIKSVVNGGGTPTGLAVQKNAVLPPSCPGLLSVG